MIHWDRSAGKAWSTKETCCMDDYFDAEEHDHGDAAQNTVDSSDKGNTLYCRRCFKERKDKERKDRV